MSTDIQPQEDVSASQVLLLSNTLRGSAMGSIFWGIVAIGLGVVGLEIHPINGILLVLGLLLMLEGVLLLATPHPGGLIADGIMMILIGIWNLGNTINDMGEGSGIHFFLILGGFQVSWGIKSFMRYARIQKHFTPERSFRQCLQDGKNQLETFLSQTFSAWETGMLDEISPDYRREAETKGKTNLLRKYSKNAPLRLFFGDFPPYEGEFLISNHLLSGILVTNARVVIPDMQKGVFRHIVPIRALKEIRSVPSGRSTKNFLVTWDGAEILFEEKNEHALEFLRRYSGVPPARDTRSCPRCRSLLEVPEEPIPMKLMSCTNCSHSFFICIHCENCRSELDLDEEEIRSGNYTCPDCGHRGNVPSEEWSHSAIPGESQR